MHKAIENTFDLSDLGHLIQTNFIQTEPFISIHVLIRNTIV